MKEKYPFVTIDCSDVLRNAAKTDESVKAKIDAGELVSSEMVVNLLANEMDKE